MDYSFEEDAAAGWEETASLRRSTGNETARKCLY